MTFYSTLIFLVLSLGVIPTVAQPSDIESCEYYSKKSKSLGCSDSEYLMDFGYKYCRIFVQKEEYFSDEGILFLEQIRPCLINAMKAEKKVTCENVKTLAQKHHIKCYKTKKYCDLSSYDKFVLVLTAWPELFDAEFSATAQKISDQCT